MIKYPFLLLLLFAGLTGSSQNVGIGTPAPNASALLELQSTNKGLLLPRVADTNAISNPAKGLLIFSNASNSLWFYTGGYWQAANGGGGADIVWQAKGDSAAFTNRKYISVNPNANTAIPVEGLTVDGNLVIQQKGTVTSTAPTAAQTITQANSAIYQNIWGADSTGRIFDPSGPNNNYINNIQGNAWVDADCKISFNAADFGFATGDTLWISSGTNYRDSYFKRLTNTLVAPADFNAKGPVYFTFRSNGDNINSKGFDIAFKKIYFNTTSQNSIATTGNSFFFNSNNGAFRTGKINEAIAGNYSFAGGNNTTASGNNAVAFGIGTTASGESSFAVGKNSESIGAYSVALGENNYAGGRAAVATGLYAEATGDYSTAMGYDTQATGRYSIAMGNSTTASGTLAVTMGDRNNATGNTSTAIGSFTTAKGDNSTAMGFGTNAKSYISTAIGSRNDTFAGVSETNWLPTDPLLYIGNGNISGGPRSNAMVVYKNANVDINGYTRLGKLSEGAPEVKMKKIIIPVGPAVDGLATFSFGSGVTDDKVLGVDVLMKYDNAGTSKIPPGYRDAAGYEYNVQVQFNGITVINKPGNSANIGGKQITILVTYEE